MEAETQPLRSFAAVAAEKRLKQASLTASGMASPLLLTETSSKLPAIDAVSVTGLSPPCGCSSLGRLRIAVLPRIGKGRRERFCLVDVKEAVKATAPHAEGSMPEDDTDRVVTGERNLSPNLGRRMAATKLLGKSVFIRGLLPQDLKLEIETLSRDEALEVADFLAHTVGLAHARQLNTSDRSRWLAELKENRTRTLDAPSWLWDSVVEFIGTHEAAYLEHCRRYSLEDAALIKGDTGSDWLRKQGKTPPTRR